MNNLEEFELAVDSVMQKAITMLTQAKDTSLGRLLTYHNLEHAYGVRNAVVRIALAENVSDHDLSLLKIAAMYHDICQNSGRYNEIQSGLVAVSVMTEYSAFSPDDCLSVMKMIAATQVWFDSNGDMWQRASDDQLSKILCDADLYALGETYPIHRSITNSLLQEMNNLGNPVSRYDFLIKQQQLLQNHTFMNESATLFFPYQAENLEYTNKELATMRDS